MEQVIAQTTGNSFTKISNQQAHELRILVFKKVYDWFSSLTMSGFLGMVRPDDELVFMENYSLQQLRAYVWELFHEEFELQRGVEELPRSQYKQAKRYLNSITPAILRDHIEQNGYLSTCSESRPRNDITARRHIQSVNINRAQYGHPPLKYTGGKIIEKEVAA